MRYPYAHALVVAQQVGCQVVGPVIDDGERLHGHIDELAGHLGHVDHIVVEMLGTVEQHDERLVVGPVLEAVHFLHSLGIGGVAPYAPYCVGGVEDETAPLKHFDTRCNVFFHSVSLSALREACPGPDTINKGNSKTGHKKNKNWFLTAC